MTLALNSIIVLTKSPRYNSQLISQAKKTSPNVNIKSRCVFVYMCVYICVCMYVYIYIYIYIYNIYIYAFCVCMFVCMCVYVCVCVYIYMCTFVYVCVCVYASGVLGSLLLRMFCKCLLFSCFSSLCLKTLDSPLHQRSK